FKLFVASAKELLTPEEQRLPKITKFDVDVPLPLSLRTVDGGVEKLLYGFTVVVPKGTTAGALGDFQHKAFFDDLVLGKLDSSALEKKLAAQLGEADAKEIAAE